MRIVIVGAGSLAVAFANVLIKRGHDVVVIERDRARIDALSQYMDCGFIQGDGTKPAILREAGPGDDSYLFCLTKSDQDNILSALVGRSLRFGRVVPKLEDAEFEHLCLELGLSDTIIPDRTISRTLADLVAGRDILELSTMIKGEVRFYSFVVTEMSRGPVRALALPGETRVICVYREEKAIFPDVEFELRDGDEVVLITLARHLEALREKWDQPTENA